MTLSVASISRGIDLAGPSIALPQAVSNVPK